jgi:predicted dehydrogenase
MKKVLVVGFGSIGKRHVINLLTHSNVKIIVLTKRKNIKLEKIGKQKKISLLKSDKFGIAPNEIEIPHGKYLKFFNSLDQCLAEKPDIGFITNETRYHVPTTMKLIGAGLDLFIEKPVSDSMIGLEKISKMIKQKRLITQIGCNFRFHPCIKKIRHLVQTKSIGRVISVQLEHGSYLPDYHPWEDYQYSYSAQKKLGGGVILSQIHDLDYLYWIFGDVNEVFAISGKFSDLQTDTEDFATITLRFKNNIIGHIHLDWFQRPYFRSCKIKGTDGMIYWDSDSNRVKLFNSKENKWNIILNAKNYQKNTMYVDEIKYFLKCLRKRENTINGIEDGIRTLQIALAIKRASKLKKIVKP